MTAHRYDLGCRCRECVRAELGRLSTELAAFSKRVRHRGRISKPKEGPQKVLEARSEVVRKELSKAERRATRSIGRRAEREEQQKVAENVRTLEQGKQRLGALRQREAMRREDAPRSRDQAKDQGKKQGREAKAVLIYSCPTCGARVGETCKEPSGRSRAPHARRTSKVPVTGTVKVRSVHMVSGGGFETNRRRH
jgi:rubrerythrin